LVFFFGFLKIDVGIGIFLWFSIFFGSSFFVKVQKRSR
jgi:hypothetical protein